MKKKLRMIALFCIAVMLLTTVSVNAKELAYGNTFFATNTTTYADMMAAQARGDIIVASRRQMQRFAPTWEVETCHFEVPLSGYTWREERDGAVTMGTVSPEPPASVRIYEPDSDHFHQGYLTSWYVDPDYDHPFESETTAPDKWWVDYPCKVVFYGDLECLCW